MALSFPKRAYKSFIHSFPILLLFFIAFTGFDLSFFFLNISFSFNFIYILIFFWILKKPERFSKIEYIGNIKLLAPEYSQPKFL